MGLIPILSSDPRGGLKKHHVGLVSLEGCQTSRALVMLPVRLPKNSASGLEFNNQQQELLDFLQNI